MFREPPRACVQPTVRGQITSQIQTVRKPSIPRVHRAATLLAAAFDRIFESGSSISLFRPRSRPHRHQQPKMPTLRCVSTPRRRARGPLRSRVGDRPTRVAKPPIAFSPLEFGPIPKIPSTRAADDRHTPRRDRTAFTSRAATSRSLTPSSTTSRSPAAG